MKKLSEFVTKNKMKIGMLLLCFIVLIVAYICYTNNNKQIATLIEPEEEKVKAQLDTEPEGYTGIYTKEDLVNIKNKLSGNYILMADLDMTGVSCSPIGPTSSTPFTGIFDGNYHKISNLKIEGSYANVGMFGYVNQGTIKNIQLHGDLKGTNSKIGGSYVGGLVGYLKEGKIENAILNVRVTNNTTIESQYTGGLVGYNNNGTISKSCVKGTIRGKYDVGGLVGQNNEGTITEAYWSSGTVYGSLGRNTGGLVGYNVKGTISDTYAVGQVSGKNYVGGLIGKDSSGSISNSYAVVDVYTSNTSSSETELGGLIANYSSGSRINRSYWSTATAQNNGAGSKTTISQLLHQTTYWGWNFNTIWKIDEDSSLAYLRDVEKPAVDIEYLNCKKVILQVKNRNQIGLENATLEIKNQSGEIIKTGNTNERGIYGIVDLGAGTYTYKETIAPIGYILDETEYQFTVASDGTVTFAEDTNGIIYNDKEIIVMKDPLVITKYRANTETPLAGATIAVFYVDGNKVDEKVTGENGQVTFTGLEVGDYYYKEISAPAGYVLNNTEYHFTVENDGSVTLGEGTTKVIYNDRVRMSDEDNFTVTKMRTGTDIVLSGAVIGIFDVDGNEVTRLTTGESGTITISGLEVGNYYYKEINAPAGYVLNNTEYHFTVENDGSVKLAEGTTRIIYNDRVTMSDEDNFTVTKMRTGTEIIVSGAVIGIFDAEGNKISEQTTGENGTITISGLEVGSYYYKEISAPAGYVLNDTEYHFTVENDGTVTLAEGTTKVIYNDRVRMSDEDNFTVTKMRTGTDIALSGAVIGIFDSEGNKISEQTTGESGTITISGLEVGSYYYKEISAPAGYVLNNTEYHFTVNDDGTVTLADGVNKVIYNNRVTMTEGLTITKYRTNTTIPLAGAVIGIFDAEGNEITRLTTGESGTITISGLEVGDYYYKEISAPAGYILNNTEYHFTVTNEGTVTLAPEATKVIYNDRVTMRDGITITKKRSGTDTLLPGAVIGIFDADGNKVAEQTTSENGQVTFTGLEVGNYYYKEISAPAGYVLNDTEYYFTVENDGSVILAPETTKVIYNDRVRMSNEDNFTVTKMRTGTDIVLSGAVIGIFDVDGNEVTRLTTSETGTITISGLEVGSYYYKEISAPAGYVLNNTEYHFTVNNDGSVTFAEGVNRIIYNDRVTMTEGLTITKYRTNTETALAGATIAVFDVDGNEVTRLTTGESGTITISGLEVGNYYYKEISAPAGYVLNNTEYHFTVENDGTVTLAEGVNRIIYNDRVTMTEGLTITKYRTNTETPLGGATIAVFDVDGNKVAEKVTGENGQVTFTGLEVGSYYYKEISAPAGYVLNDTEYHFTVENDGTVTLAEGVNRIIYNDRVTMTEGLTIIKYRTNTETALAGATIAVFDVDGNKVAEKITGENGQVTFTGLEVGSYYYKEISAPAGYVLNNTEYHFTVENDGSVTLAEGVNRIIYNDRVTMSDEDNFTVTKMRTGTEIIVSGAVIGIFDAEGNKISEQTTGENGTITISGLEVGSYYYKEISAPAGYVLNNTEYHFTVENDGTVTLAEGVNRIIYNDRVTMTEGLTIIKYRTNTETPLAGAVIGVFDADGTELVRQTTNEVGQVTFTGLEVGNYYYKEISAPVGYVLNNTEYHFTVNNDGSVTLGEGTTKVIYNDRVRMSDEDNFTVTKMRTGTDIALSGAVIGIFDSEGNEVTRATTGESGTITISGLEVGSYYYKEISAPAGYVLNNTEYHFTVENDGTVTLAEGVNRIIYNDRVTMSDEDNFTVTKMRTGTDTVLSGAVIGIFDAEGNEITRLTTGESGTITIRGLEVGNYYYKEISAPAGYVLNNTEYHFTVNNDGSVTLGEGTTKVIYNDRVTMTEGLTIIKYRTNTETALAGATIAVFDVDGNKVVEKVTGENGQVIFTGLEVGSYYYKEISAPAGYVLNDTEYHFTVENDGTVTLAEGVNRIIYNDRKLVYGDVTITKYITGTTTPLSGAVIAIYKEDGTPMLDKEGNPVKIATSELGTITFKITPGTYMYKEISAPTGYKLNDTTYSFTVSEDGIVTFDSANGIIYNDREIVYGDVTIRKYITDTQTPLAGAVIGIYRTDGTPMTDKEGNPVQITTSADGTIKFKIIPGTYMYKEITAPTGYVLDNTEHTFTVSEEGIVTFDSANGIIYNTRVTMREGLVITKYKTGTDTVVSGAVIGLFDETGKELARGTTNEEGQVTFTGLEIGTYYYKEISAPAGYILNNTEYHFTVENDGSVTLAEGTTKVIYNDRVKAAHTIITKYITDSTTPLAGAVIGLFDASGNKLAEQTTNASGQVDFAGLEPGTYKYKELTAPDGYVLNDTMYTFTIKDDGTVTFDSANGVIYNTRVTMHESLVITKYRTGTDIVVSGAVIGIFDETGKELARETTNKAGQVTFTGLEVGNYYYKEISAPAGYILNNTEYHFTVENDGSVTLAKGSTKVIYNDRVSKDHIIITKYVTETTTPVSGAIIGLFDVSGNKLAEQTTNASGQVDFAGLEPGTYKYKELIAPDGYVLNDTMYTFTIKDDGTVTFDSANGIIYDSRIKMEEDLIIVKYRTNTQIPLAGAVIGLFDERGKEIERQTTDERGQVTFTGLEVGNYYYKEISAPTGYVLNNTEYYFTVENDGSVTLAKGSTKVIYNDRVTVDHVIITKYAEGTKTPVAGAVIGLFDANGNKLAEQTTNEKGQVDFAGLEPGTYKYKELTAPNGYILNDTIYTFNIAEDGTVTFDSAYGIIYNKKKVDVPEVIYGDITLIKYEEGTTNVLEGAVIGLYDANGNAIRNAEGNVIQFITNEFGEIKFKAKPGTYKYKELIAPEGYELNDTVYTFTIKEDGTVIFDSANGIIYNKKKEDIPDIPHEPDVPEIYGEVTLTKYEEGTKIALKGATIGIYDSEKNEIKVTTNDNGEVKLKLKPGAYQYQELIAPEGYELDNTIYTFTITKTGKVIFDNDTNGIIYDKKKEDKPDKPDIPEEPNKPDVPDKPKDNVIVPEDNTIIKQPAENLANGRLPQTGETEGMIIITAMFAIVGIYFGIKIRDKQ